jgi:hypothetical protein
LSKEPIVAYRAIANIQSRPQLEPEQLPSTTGLAALAPKQGYENIAAARAAPSAA